jgi:hypothetical protein
MERRLVVTQLTDRANPREDAVVYRARFSHQAGSLEFGLWNKSNDFTHVGLQNWYSVALDDEYHFKKIGNPSWICTESAVPKG